MGFQQGLAEAGWREGQDISFEVRWGAADAARIDAYAAELVKLKPDVILATNTPTARSLKLATDSIPIVFAGLSDPIGDGVVASLSKPGRNITGFTSFNAPIAGKWLQLVKELSPATTRIGIIYNPQDGAICYLSAGDAGYCAQARDCGRAHAGERSGRD